MASVLDDIGGIIQIAQIHDSFFKEHRVPAVIGQIISMIEMQNRTCCELAAVVVTERLDDAYGCAWGNIPDIQNAVIFPCGR